jgi:hypothetical protein
LYSIKNYFGRLDLDLDLFFAITKLQNSQRGIHTVLKKRIIDVKPMYVNILNDYKNRSWIKDLLL